jgi:hypothetical protein
LHDNRHGTNHHAEVFEPWWRYAREHYLDLDQGTPTATTLYYDPILDVHHRLPVAAALTTAYYAAPQVSDDARLLFDAACTSMGLDRELSLPIAASRGYGSSLVLAREWSMTELKERLVAAIEGSYEPTWDRVLGEFTWGLGLGEAHPRGQYNAFLAAAEAAGPGRWERLSAAPIERQPQVVGVDFPNVALRTAEWRSGSLHLELDVHDEDPSSRTMFRIVGAEPRIWELTGIDGASLEHTAHAVIVRVPKVSGRLTFTRGSY